MQGTSEFVLEVLTSTLDRSLECRLQSADVSLLVRPSHPNRREGLTFVF